MRVSLYLIVSIFMAVSLQAEGACRADAKRLCAGIQSGEGRIMKCLKEKEAELSADCKSHREQMKAQNSKIKEACQDDVALYCSGIKAGEGRIRMCLKENEANLSAGCKAASDEKKMMKEQKKAENKAMKDENKKMMSAPAGQ